MALIQHTNIQVRFDQQADNSAHYVLPFIESTHVIDATTSVMEVGCSEGGVLRPFLERGCTCLGVDLEQNRIDNANRLLADEVAKGKATFVCQNIYEAAFVARYEHSFDIIILKDVIEHVPEQEKFIPHLMRFLKPGGQIFFGFPPWYMPFGGHQQVCAGKLTSKLPYYHILPRPLYLGFLKMMGESPTTIQTLAEIWDTSITIGQFEKYVKRAGLKVIHKQHYLINPIYKFKFGLQPRKQAAFVGYIPFLRNFITTCVYYTVAPL
ncbi:MAG: class I SAM-dependent methyltransferase [Chitinophagaceae bacterium]